MMTCFSTACCRADCDVMWGDVSACPLQVSGLMSFKRDEAQPLVQQALEAIDDMNNALALTKDVRRLLQPQMLKAVLLIAALLTILIISV